jgi:hypothetical protein
VLDIPFLTVFEPKKKSLITEGNGYVDEDSDPLNEDALNGEK